MKSISRYICKCTIKYMGKNCEKKKHGIILLMHGTSFNWSPPGRIFPSLNVPNSPNPGQQVHTQKIPFPPIHMIPPPPSTNRLSNINHNPVRRIFPRTWIWEEVHMRFEH